MKMAIRNIQFPTNLPSNFAQLQQIQDITDALPKNKNYSWKQLTGERNPNTLTDIVVHHSGMEKRLNLTAESHAKSHINTTRNEPLGDPGIPYHVYINRGRVYQVNDLIDFVYGVASNNGYTVHICVEGNYLIDELSDQDRLCLYGAILSVKSILPIKNIKGHNQYNATACPAFDMDRVRRDIQTIESEMAYQETPDAAVESAVRVMTRVTNLYNNASHKTYGPEAKRKLALVDRFMKDNGFYP